jgi:hypothetical protein
MPFAPILASPSASLFRRRLRVLPLLFLAAIALACTVARAASAGASASGDSSGADLYVARRGWHVDVGFDATAIIALPLAAVTADLPGSRYVFFGFGDRRYLLSRHHSLPAMLGAVWPGKGLILATGLTASPAEAFGAGSVIRLHLTVDQALAAQTFIARSLSRSVAGGGTGDGAGRADAPAVSLGSGPYDGSLYFAAGPTYSAAHTCNTWAAEVLKSAGLDVRTRGVVFAGQLWRQARRLSALRP